MNGCAEFMKTTKIKFKIGEFSKPNRITVKTLRHYEEIGPLGPEQADKRTGYRYYGACQLGRMNTIRHLKGPGFTTQIPAVRHPCRHTLSTSVACRCRGRYLYMYQNFLQKHSTMHYKVQIFLHIFAV